MKKIYSLDSATLGQEKTVNDGYKINALYETDQQPPKQAIILAWDSKTQSWYDAGASVGEGLETQDQQLTDAMMAIAELYEQKLLLETRVAELETIVLPK